MEMRKVISFPILMWLGVAIATGWLVILLAGRGIANPSLPPLQIHPLPSALAQWQAPANAGDYFDRIKSTPAGYLIWSDFPIKVYRDRPTNSQDNSASDRRFEQWTNAVAVAIAEWNVYLPLIEVQQPKLADIAIKREQPPLGVTINRETGQVERFRARSAQTRYEFYIKGDNPPILSHRMTILINPGMSDRAILSATRHELGHALGIWGHSPDNNDIMYYSQVRTPPEISPRDINTLKKIYQQPTRLGWQLTVNSNQ
jgi:predicted Zn-dependent protease